MDVKTIARAAKRAMDIREQSYVEGTDTVGSLFHCGEYTISREDACIKACEEEKLPKEFWYLLHLALHWSNDVDNWADAVLTDKFDELFVNPRE